MSIHIKFDPNQQYQRDAIDSVVELFDGQESLEQGVALPGFGDDGAIEEFQELVFGNTLALAPETLRLNLLRVQDRRVEQEDGANGPAVAKGIRRPLEDGEVPASYSVEMETGTGKTYVYLRTIAELHQRYGFKKFMIVVPSVAIREGVLDSLRLLKEHIRDVYDGLQYDSHVYDSSALGRVRQFATTPHLQIMVVNIAAMVGDKNNRIIHRPTDAMNGYAPIEFLRACRPVVIMDEPQSLDGPTHGPAIDELNPLFRVGYSATPPTDKKGLPKAHLIHRLTPVDAYNQRLVKRIGVLSIEKDPDFNEPYVEVKKITASSKDVTATIRLHVAGKQGTKEVNKTIRKDDDLFEISGHREIYRGWTIEDIHAGERQEVEFGNGRHVGLDRSTSEADDQQMRLMLRQTIESHFEKELQLKLAERRGVIPAVIKPLTLFFIERVAHYAPEDAKLRQWFEEEYEAVRADGKYRNLRMPDVADVHDGYFAETAKGEAKDAKANTSYAATAFERIMQNKEDLLSFDEPLRFIFSHSALAEGWDNPNVFTICNLQDGKSTMRRRQQVGRGLRLPVMANGERCHVDEINLLTVVAKVGFAAFADQLQREIEEETGVKFTGRIVNMREKQTVKLKEKALESPEFRELWRRISPRTTYHLDFSTDAVVKEAVRRIDEMPKPEPVKFRVGKDVIAMDSEAVKGSDARSRGEVVAASYGTIPDVVGELTRRLALSRATVVRILRECSRLDDVRINPAVFLDQVTDAINSALYAQLAEGIVYKQRDDAWSMDLIRERHTTETVAHKDRVVPVNKSITDRIVCDSQVEVDFAKAVDARDDVPLFVKLPDWFKITTPLGNYNPDWALVRRTEAGDELYLVRETKGTDMIEDLQWESEGWKIKFGRAHFKALRVDYAFGHDANVLLDPEHRLASADN